MKSLKDAVLEVPWVYDAVQWFLGTAELKSILFAELRGFESKEALELGSGTGMFSPAGFSALTVTDVNQAYLDQIQVPCTKVVVSAATLPFEDDRFDVIFAAGLYHHLSDEEYAASLREVKRTLKPGGLFVNMDNLPPTRWYRVFAWVFRKMDRGHFVRKIAHQQALIEKGLKLESSTAGAYAWCGLEYVVHRCRKR